MRHLDLFSGIGGFAYAIDQVWPKAEHIFCDIDPFCQAVLGKHWPRSRIYGDIAEVIEDTSDERLQGRVVREEGKQEESERLLPSRPISIDRNTEGNPGDKVGEVQKGESPISRGSDSIVADTDPAGQQDRDGQHRRLSSQEGTGVDSGCGCGEFRGIDILTGGFPCQPFSHAGKRRGRGDSRYLWPAMLRVIRQTKPRWVVAENVYGILSLEGGLVFEQVCLDLEEAGYEVRAFVIPAAGVNAPHRRDRVWFIGHRSDSDCDGFDGETATKDSDAPSDFGNPRIETDDSEKPGLSQEPEPRRGDKDAQQPSTHATGQRNGGGSDGDKARCGCSLQTERPDSDAPDTELRRCVHGQAQVESAEGRIDALGHNASSGWQENWPEVAARLCGVDDGLPTWMDGAPISKAKHRVERLKSLGNSIVPQVAVQIMRAIKEADRNA